VEPVIKQTDVELTLPQSNVSREFIWFKSNQIVKAAMILTKEVEKTNNIEELSYLIRSARHPDFLWEINYITPSENLNIINDLVISIEPNLFKSVLSIELKERYSCSPSALMMLNIVRAYIKAEKGQITDSMTLWNQLYEIDYSVFPVIRQCNLLMHLYIVFLCTKDFEKAHSCYIKLFSLLKVINLKTLHETGIIDNISIIYTIQSFFAKHVPEFLSFLSDKLHVPTRNLLSHKKVTTLVFTPMQFIVQICTKPFYDHAKSKMPLPDYDIDSFHKKDYHPVSDSISEWEEKYSETINSEYSTTLEKSARKWDLYFDRIIKSKIEIEQTDDSKSLVEMFPECSYLVEPFSSVLDIGCGLSSSPLRCFSDKKITRIDISRYVYNYWLEKENPIIEISAESFFENNKCVYDLCFCSHVLPAIVSQDFVLEKCSQTCKYIIISLKSSVSDLIPLSQHIDQKWINNVSDDEWIIRISKYFDIIYTHPQNWEFIVVGKSKHFYDNIS